MGRSTPKRRVFCTKCREKYRADYLRSNFSPRFLRWFNVTPVSLNNGYVTLRCKTCGHTYKSSSVSAFNAAEHNGLKDEEKN